MRDLLANLTGRITFNRLMRASRPDAPNTKNAASQIPGAFERQSARADSMDHLAVAVGSVRINDQPVELVVSGQVRQCGSFAAGHGRERVLLIGDRPRARFLPVVGQP